MSTTFFVDNAMGPRSGASARGTVALAEQASQLALLLSHASLVAARLSQALANPRRRRARGKGHKQGTASADTSSGSAGSESPSKSSYCGRFPQPPTPVATSSAGVAKPSRSSHGGRSPPATPPRQHASDAIALGHVHDAAQAITSRDPARVWRAPQHVCKSAGWRTAFVTSAVTFVNAHGNASRAEGLARHGKRVEI